MCKAGEIWEIQSLPNETFWAIETNNASEWDMTDEFT